jgi:ankyrin repeat protein
MRSKVKKFKDSISEQDQKDDDDNLPLHIAAMFSSENLIRPMISRGSLASIV